MPELLASPRASQKPFKEPEQTLACMFDAIERRADSMKSRTASRTDANSGNISTIPASHACGTRQLPNYRTNQSIA
jgi:hypothetical protein